MYFGTRQAWHADGMHAPALKVEMKITIELEQEIDGASHISL